MIIFSLDGTLADCEHRRHFVDVYKNPTYEFVPKNNELDWREGYYCNLVSTPYFGKQWKPDWQAFYEACDKDVPIEHVIDIFRQLNDDEYNETEIQIWSGRCESVRDKAEQWLCKHTSFSKMNCHVLKMRPIGDNTPDHELKERWLIELWPKLEATTKENMRKVYHRTDVDFVFESDPASIAMYRRRDVFVFDVNQKNLTHYETNNAKRIG